MACSTRDLLTSKCSFVCHGTRLTQSDDDDEFNDRIVNDLIRRLDGPVRLPLSTHEKALLITVIEGTHEVCHI